MSKILLSLGVLLMATSAFGMRRDRGGDRGRSRLVHQTYEITYRRGEQEFRRGDVIGIKRELRKRGVDVQNIAVESVTLRAKSKAGRGRAVLLVGNRQSESAPVLGDKNSPRRPRRAFYDRGGFNRVTLYSPVGVRRQLRNRGRVQVELRGNIRVRKVIVDVVRERRRGRDGRGNGRRRHVDNRTDKEKRRDAAIGIGIGIIGEIIKDKNKDKNKPRRKRP